MEALSDEKVNIRLRCWETQHQANTVPICVVYWAEANFQLRSVSRKNIEWGGGGGAAVFCTPPPRQSRKQEVSLYCLYAEQASKQ